MCTGWARGAADLDQAVEQHEAVLVYARDGLGLPCDPGLVGLVGLAHDGVQLLQLPGLCNDRACAAARPPVQAALLEPAQPWALSRRMLL